MPDSWLPPPEIVIELVWGTTWASGFFEAANAQPERREPLNWGIRWHVCDLYVLSALNGGDPYVLGCDPTGERGTRDLPKETS